MEEFKKFLYILIGGLMIVNITNILLDESLTGVQIPFMTRAIVGSILGTAIIMFLMKLFNVSPKRIFG
jgi:uncharacterized membrane protein